MKSTTVRHGNTTVYYAFLFSSRHIVPAPLSADAGRRCVADVLGQLAPMGIGDAVATEDLGATLVAWPGPLRDGDLSC